jgi:NADPH2:quinone reductase
MRAIIVRSFGGPDVLQIEDVPDPTPGPGQIRVRLHAIGVNPYDTYMRSGAYAMKPALPYTPGADAAGTVDAVGDGVTGWQGGERVYIGGTVQNPAYGAYAELVLCLPHQLHPLPERVTFAQGAAINVPYVTAWRAVFDCAHARAGDSIFIHGASGGVGLATSQIARAAGLTVIGSAGSEEGRAIVAQWAHHVVDHRAPGYLERIKTLTDGRGPDIIVEMLANVNLDADLGLIARGGHIVIVGNRGRIEIDPRQIMARHSIVTGTHLWSLTDDVVARAHRGLVAGLESGALTPVVSTELPLSDATKAHEMVMGSNARGKIVLVTS